MKEFFRHNFNIEKIVLACYVPKGGGEAIHTNRASHGLAFHTSGEKKYTFENGDVFSAKKNDVIYMPKHSDYVMDAKSPGDCYAINFLIADDVSFEPFIFNMGDLLADKFRSAEKAFRTKSPGYEMLCKANLYSIICAMLVEYERKYVPKSTERIIMPAIEYIHQNYTSENISAEHLADLCGISTAYLRRIFLNCKNVTPIKYINNLRLSRAKELIASDYYTVSKICELSGFGDESYFCRYFKKTVGMTPTEYKKCLLNR